MRRKDIEEKPKPTLTVIRGGRGEEAQFYAAFEKFDVRFIYGSDKGHDFSYIKPKNRIEFINLPLKPAFFIEPIKLLTGSYNSRSWSIPQGLINHLQGSDVISLTDTYYVFNLWVARYAKQENIPVATVIWETIPNHPSRFFPPYSFSVKETVSATDIFIPRSHLAAGYVRSLGVPEKKIKVIYKGVDLSFFRPASRRKSRNSKLKILYVGSLVEHKGIEELLQAFKQLCREDKNLELWFAGRGAFEARVRQAARDYPIKYFGFVNFSRLPEIYRGADIFCLPTKDIKFFGLKLVEERFSYALMEAQASGLPIVATRCGGIPEEIGEGNFLVDQGDVKQLYQALKKLAEDDKLRIKIAKGNRRRAEKLFELKRQVEKTEKAMVSIL